MISANAHVADAFGRLMPPLRICPTSAVWVRKKDVPLHDIFTLLSSEGPAHMIQLSIRCQVSCVKRCMHTQQRSPVCWVPNVTWTVGCVGRWYAIDGRPCRRECQTLPSCLRKHVRIDGVVHSVMLHPACSERVMHPVLRNMNSRRTLVLRRSLQREWGVLGVHCNK